MPDRTPLVCVTGPTASGKTALGIAVAEAVGGEIVSCDAMAVYRGMDIGTAKPTPEERARVPHHLLDVTEWREPMTAGRYEKLADAAIADIARRGGRAVVVGGTGLYLKALLEGVFEVPAAPEALRSALRERARREGLGALHAELARLDPETAARLSPKDAPRIFRALEVHAQTGRPISAWRATHGFRKDRYDARVLAIDLPREALYARIDARIDRMMEDGLLEEVRRLRDAGLSAAFPAGKALGYKQLMAYLAGSRTLPEAVESAKRETRRFAKRQLTWLRAVPGVLPVAPDAAGAAEAARLAREHFAKTGA